MLESVKLLMDTMVESNAEYLLVVGSELKNPFQSAKGLAQLVNDGLVKYIAAQPNDAFENELRGSIGEKFFTLNSDESLSRLRVLVKEIASVVTAIGPKDSHIMDVIAKAGSFQSPPIFIFDSLPSEKVIEMFGEQNPVLLRVPNLGEFLQEFRRSYSEQYVEKGVAFAARKPVKVLAIDGGGIRGVIPARILAELEARTGKRVSEMFDLISGTSTGGILALGLSAPNAPGSVMPMHTASKLEQLYLSHGAFIFPTHPPRSPGLCRFLKGATSFVPALNKFPTALNSILSRPYSPAGLDRTLKQFFYFDPNTPIKVSDAINNVLITSYDLSSRQPKWFTREAARALPEREDVPMAFALRCTSAAPTFFPPAIRDLQNASVNAALIDGGVLANNPALCAYVQAKRLYPGREVLVLSLGTGTNFAPTSVADVMSWNTGEWAVPLLSTMFEAASDCTNHNLRWLLPNKGSARQYFRMQVQLGQVSDAIDDAENVQNLANRTANALQNELADTFDDVVAAFH